MSLSKLRFSPVTRRLFFIFREKPRTPLSLTWPRQPTWVIKSGMASRSDRTAKYNQLLRIEEGLGATVVFQGEKVFYGLGEV